MKKIILTVLVTTVFSVVLVGSSSAALISGSIGFDVIGGGGWQPLTGYNTGNTPGIEFIPTADPSAGPPAIYNLDVTSTFGDFVGASSEGFIYDFNFRDDLPSVSATPLSFLLWEVDDFDFFADTVVLSFQNASNIVLEGTGTVMAPGFENTPGIWNVTLNQSNQSFTWSGSSSTVIPEPATMLLFGTGLVGLAGLGRRKLKKK